MRSLPKKSAFTLLEMLFVIVIMSAMFSLGIMYYRQQTQTKKIDKASLQIQQLLQAGVAYVQVNNKWPTDCLQLYANDQNPWGKKYSCQLAPNKQDVFQVTTTLAKDDAEQLQGQLANAYLDADCDEDSCKLTAEIAVTNNPQNSLSTIMTASANSNEKVIGGLGQGKDGDTATAICPANTTPTFYTAIGNLGFAPSKGIFITYSLTSAVVNPTKSSDAKTWHGQIQVKQYFGPRSNPSTNPSWYQWKDVAVTYIAVCKPQASS